MGTFAAKSSRLVIFSDDNEVVEKARLFARNNNLNIEVHSVLQRQCAELEVGAPHKVLELNFDSSTENSTDGKIGIFRKSRERGVLPLEEKLKSAKPIKVLQTIREIEEVQIKKAIVKFKGNLTEAAKALGLGRATLYRRVKILQINLSELRSFVDAA